MKLRLLAVLSLMFGLSSIGLAQDAKISWKKFVIDAKFRSEGVAIADVNKDGKPDILVGDFWYEAPDWKPHEIRKPGDFKDGSGGYSQSFLCWAEDLNGDGWSDLIVVGFPSEPCRWYENPQGKEGHWKEHIICKSACNETPQYADLFGTGKRVLVMAYDDKQMIWLDPAKDPTQPWNMHPISDPATKAPGTHRYAHGLGVGDLNGDGRADVLCNDGWWEQPAKLDDQPWKFHKVSLSQPCADMHVVDVDGDGRMDVITSSAHNYGMWTQLQRGSKEDPTFVTESLFPAPAALAKLPANYKVSPEEQKLFEAINQTRDKSRRAPFAATEELCKAARGSAENLKIELKSNVIVLVTTGRKGQTLAEIAKDFFHDARLTPKHDLPNCEIGVGYFKNEKGEERYAFAIQSSNRFTLPSQTHAMHFVDIDGDGVKDLVTGRRWWAHGPNGDSGANDPANLFWFKGKRDSKGMLSFTPFQVDDHSGVGTQFSIADMNGDGVPDIIVSNKRGVYLFLQVRIGGAISPPARKE